MTEKRFTIIGTQIGRVIRDNETDINTGDIGIIFDWLNGLAEENKELKKQLRREETDKKRLMTLLMKYKSYSFDEIVENILDEPYYDNWWENGFYEYCWDEYLKEKGFDGCDEE